MIGVQPKVFGCHDGVAQVRRDDDHATTRGQVTVDEGEQLDLFLGFEMLDEVRCDDAVVLTRVGLGMLFKEVDDVPDECVQLKRNEFADRLFVVVDACRCCACGFELLYEEALAATKVEHMVTAA